MIMQIAKPSESPIKDVPDRQRTIAFVKLEILTLAHALIIHRYIFLKPYSLGKNRRTNDSYANRLPIVRNIEIGIM